MIDSKHLASDDTKRNAIMARLEQIFEPLARTADDPTMHAAIDATAFELLALIGGFSHNYEQEYQRVRLLMDDVWSQIRAAGKLA